VKVLIILMILVSSINLTATDFNPERFFSSKCAACHGKNARGNPNFAPNLAGQHQLYLFQQLQDFSKKKRTNRNSIFMYERLKGLSDKELKELSKYLSNLKCGG